MHANFVNRFLRLLSEYDWSFSALVVDINCDLSQNDKREISVSSQLSEFFLKKKRKKKYMIILVHVYSKVSGLIFHLTAL